MSKTGFTENNNVGGSSTIFRSNVSNIQNWDGGGNLDEVYSFGQQKLNDVLTLLSYYVNSFIENEDQISMFANNLEEL